MLNRLITFSVALPIVALPLGVPIAAALDPTSAQAAQGARFVEGLSVSVHRGANNQVVVVAHRMSNGGIRYPWSFQMKAQVGERVIRVTAPAGYDGGEAVHEFPPNTEWVAVRDDLSGWKRKAPPPGDPSIRYYPGAFFLRVSETGIPARWNPCASHTWGARGPATTPKNLRLLRATFKYVADGTGLVFTRAKDSAVPPDMNVTMTWKGGISYGGPVDTVTVDPADSGGPEVIQSGMMRMNLSRGMSTHVARFLLLHEMGHALNMGHNPAPKSVMRSQSSDQFPLTFTNQDRKTLRHLDKSQGCLTAQSPG